MMTIEEQLAADKALAMQLQQSEGEHHHDREVSRDIAIKVGIDPDDDSTLLACINIVFSFWR